MTYSPDGDRRRSPYRHSPSPPHMAMSMSIPIPPQYEGGNRDGPSAERSPRPLASPSSSRSPSQSSLSSYRAHPYPRRHSLSDRAHQQQQQQQQQQQAPEDARYLPPPNSVAPLHVLHERSREREQPRVDSGRDARSHDPRAHESRDWRDRRPSLPRAQSDGRYTLANERGGGYQLPSFASLSATSSSGSSSLAVGPLTPTSMMGSERSGNMGPPAALPPTSPGSSRAASPKLFGLGGLRPSYSYENTSSGGHPSQSPSRPTLGLGGVPPSGASCYRTDPSPPRYGAQQSPPLRSIQSLAPPNGGYSPEHYMHPQVGRSRSHSAASAMSRYGARSASSSDGGDWAGPPTPRDNSAQYAPTPTSGGGGGGQSRRLAHLMSEQKRRESINTGFQALRGALPSSIPTDSKAIILRKAVSHIGHLEGLLRKAGINFGTSTGASNAPSVPRHDSGSTQGGDGDEDMRRDEDPDRADVIMREATGAVNALKMDKAGWEDCQVEDIEVERKPSVKV